MSADYEQENQILEVSTVQSYENTSVEKIRCKSFALKYRGWACISENVSCEISL